MPAATTSRSRKPGLSVDAKPTKKPTTKSRAPPKPVSDTEKLAAHLAETLTIGDGSRGKGKQKALSIEEQRLEAMRMINNASQKLSALVQSGWKKSSDQAKTEPAAGAHDASKSAAKHLAVLRKLSTSDLNVERAAVSILGKLVALELFEPALTALADIHPRLCALVGEQTGNLLSIPKPEPHFKNDIVLLTLISTYLFNAVLIQIHTHLSKFSQNLSNGNTLLEWISYCSSSGLPAKHLDSILTKIYSVLMKVSEVSITSNDIFKIRMYALRGLAHTTPGIVQKPDSLWDQACKVAGAFSNTCSSDSISQAAQTVATAFLKLVTICEMRPDYDVFVSGKGFATFCETWIGFASKANDAQVLDKIATLMRRDSPTSLTVPLDSASTSPIPSDNGDLMRRGTRICAAFAQLLTVLDHEEDEAMISRIQDVHNALSNPHNKSTVMTLLQMSCDLDGAEGRDKDIARIAGKVDRALGRARKACLDKLEKILSNIIREELIKLLETMISVYESAIQVTNSNDHFTHVLDTLFFLSRSILHIPDPRTYGTAYDLLAKAVEILSLSTSSSSLLHRSSPASTLRSDLIRCTSGAFYFIGGSLYQAERYSSAISFVKEACRLGDAAIVERERCKDHCGCEEGRTEKDTKSDSWKQLEDQLWRRYQVLAACYLKIGDRRLAFDTLILCVDTFPYSAFEKSVNKVVFRSLSGISPAVRELQGVVEKLTHLGVCELLLSTRDVSLELKKSPGTAAPVLGVLMEWQIQSLEGNRWKASVRNVLADLLLKTLNMYRDGRMPVRSLRVLAKVLELAYHTPLDEPIWNKLGWLSLERIEDEMKEITASKDLGLDADLSHFRSEYEASIHLWLALLAHRHSDSNQVALVGNHTGAACTILCALSSPATTKESSDAPENPLPDQSSAAKVESRKPLKGSKTVVVRAKGRSGLSSRGRSAKTPVTPKRKVVARTEDIPPCSSMTMASVEPRSLEFDSMELLMNLLQLSSHVLGMLSLTVPKIKVLDIWRKFGQRSLGENSDRYLSSSSELALEYLKLGKVKRANKVLNQASSTAQSRLVSDGARAIFFLTLAACCAYDNDVKQSIKFYQQGSILAGSGEIPSKHASAAEKIQAHVSRIEQTAFAYEVFALIQNARNNVSDSLDALLQALRLWNRAFESLARLQPPTAKVKPREESNPFEASSPKELLSTPTTSQISQEAAAPQSEPPFRSTGNYTQRRSLSTGLEWRVSQRLLSTLFSLFRAYLERGSPREAQYFAEQAKALSQSLNAPAGVCRALVKSGEVKLFQGLLKEGSEHFEEIEQWVKIGATEVDLAEVYQLKGDLEQRGFMIADAQKHYQDAMEVIERVDREFSLLDGTEFGPRLSMGTSSIFGTLLPDLSAQVLSRYAWLLRADRDKTFMELLEKFDSMPSTSTTQSQKLSLFARLALHDVYQHSRFDMFLSSIGETAIALSAGSNNLNLSLASSSMEMAKNLEHAEQLFWSYLGALGRKGYAPDIRAAAISIAIIKIFQASLGRGDPRTPLLTAGLLDASSSLTLRNELLEAIANKFPVILRHDELEWPRLSDSGVPLPHGSEHQGLDENLSEESLLKRYWATVRDRYQSHAINAETLTLSMVSELPRNWTVVHISITEDRNTMFISRQRGGGQAQPLVFCVPLKGRREDEDDKHLTFEDALTEMNEIVRLSNETTKVASSIRHDRQARAQWWKERGALDTRLRELLENIEFCWLGAFKTILSKNPHLSLEAINSFRIQFDRVFQRGLRLQDRKTKERALGHKKKPSESWTTPNRVTLDDALVECFSTLTPDCRDEELEDLVYFILDLYQFHGVPVAIAEVDIDQVVVDLRSVIEEHAEKVGSVGHGRSGAFGYRSRDHDDEHLFLVLDKNVQGLPWENIPILRERSVSRIPSVSFLLDRIHYSRLRQSGDDGHFDRAVVDPQKAYYIINPSGDLDRTEERFKPWLKEMEKSGWQGISGRAPSELQFLNALEQKDLVVYFGHGGAEQYVRSHKLRNLPRCAAVMLWGCSSGALRDMGDFDRVGTPLNYMLAGCPTLVATLWDVTDKDIDVFSQSVFDKLNMSSESISKWPLKSENHTPMSVIQAVAESRTSCKLKYLTGAAPVVYGIPFYL